MNSEVNYISSIESADEVTLTAAEIALKLAGDYNVKRSGETRVSSTDPFTEYTKEYVVSVTADGNDIIISNADGVNNAFRGTIDAENYSIYFDKPNISYWYAGVSASDYSSGFTAGISEDLQTLTFEEWHKVWGTKLYETSTYHVMTRVSDPVLVWEVEGNISWTGDDGKDSYYISSLEGVKLSKYARGEEAFYQLEHLGGAYYNAPMMEFEVVDGKISPLNWGSYKRYLSIQGGCDTVYPMVDNSSFEGDEEGGKFTFAYDCHEYYYSSTSETGTMTFVWGTYAVEKFVPEYTTDPADGSVINDAVDEAYLQFSGYCDIMYTDKAQIVVKDAEGNEVNTNAYFEYNYGDYSKIRISNLGLTESGTYTITVKGNSLTVSTNYLSYKTVTGDVSFTITVERVWEGSVVLPETVASTDELLSIPVTFPYAEQVTLMNFGVLGAVFSEGGDVFALLFLDTYTGEVEIDGSTVNVRFEKMSDLRAQNAALAETLA